MQRIEDYAIIGDAHTVGLVGANGSIDWLCLPRFDSDACFAALLGDEDNGLWQIAPAGADRCTSRQYDGDTLILETRWDLEGGSVKIIDFMPPRNQQPDLVRIVVGLSGSVPMRSFLKIRFDYGRVTPWVYRIDGQFAAVGGPDSLYLRGDVEHHGEDFATVADFTVSAGDRLGFVLTWHPSHYSPPMPADPEATLRETHEHWTEWAARCQTRGPYRQAITRSLLTLKALTYAPTGAIVAAPTTSLPEHIGGVRNWDYRYCWLRDATMTLESLLNAGFTEEAQAWTSWLQRAIAGSPRDVQIMYGVAGERRLPEYELSWLRGYEDSQPVRIGNAAAGQLQLDVYGAVMSAMALAREKDVPGMFESWPLQRALTEHLATIWQEPDEGIWEMRGGRQHFTHSKMLAWAAFDRAATAVERYGRPGPAKRWRALADEVHREVCANAYDKKRGAFVQAYGSKRLDAAVLQMPRLGFLPGDDPRVVSTVQTIRKELSENGLVRRYETSERDGVNVDGLPGREGALLVCSFWLIDAEYWIGETDRARERFETLLSLRNDVGLLAEMYDPMEGRQLGNFPQAFSHIGLVNTAFLLENAAAST